MSGIGSTEPPRQHSTDGAGPAKLKGSLGAPGLVLTALAFNAPLAVMAGFIPIVIATGLGAATPVVYLAIMVLALIFAVGLTTMARHMTKPGAFYAYITAGLGKSPGLGAGFVALFSYLAIGTASYVLSGILISEFVHVTLNGPDLPWWVWACLQWGVVSSLSLLNIDLSTRILGACLAVEVIIVLAYDVAVFANGGPEGRGLDLTAQLQTGSSGFALLWAVTCLTGFESIQIFRAEARDADRTIPRATYATVILLAGFYALGSWAYLTAFGTDAAIATASTPTQSFLDSLQLYAGTVVRDLASAMMVTSALAALLAIQNISARYMFSLARDGVLPPALGVVSRRFHAPSRSAAAVAGVLLVAMLLPAVFEFDPVAFYTGVSGLGNYALISLIAGTALAVFVYFRRRRSKINESTWKTVVAPFVSFLGLAFVVYQATVNRDALIGLSPSKAAWLLIVIAVIGLGGVAYARWLRSRRPAIYQQIGNQDPDVIHTKDAAVDDASARQPEDA